MMNMLQKKAETKQKQLEAKNDLLVVQPIAEGHRALDSRPNKISKSSFKPKRNQNKGKFDICEYPPRELEIIEHDVSAYTETENGDDGAVYVVPGKDYDYDANQYSNEYTISDEYSSNYDDIVYEISSRRRRNAAKRENAKYAAPWSVELLDENNSFLCNGILFKNGLILSLAICHETRIPSIGIVNGQILDLIPSMIQPNLSISKNGFIVNNLQVFKHPTDAKPSYNAPKCFPKATSKLSEFTGRCFIENKFFEKVLISDCSKSLGIGIGSSKESICLFNSIQNNGHNDLCEYSLGTPVACETQSNGFKIIGLISSKILPCNVNSHIGLVSIDSNIEWLESLKF